MKSVAPYILGLFIAIFGLLTLYLSGSIIFDLFGVREAQGNYVPFVIWANFISSLIYLVSAYGVISKQSWTPKLLSGSVIILLITGVGFYFYVQAGGVHEAKTSAAIPFRIVVTSVFMFLSWFIRPKK